MSNYVNWLSNVLGKWQWSGISAADMSRAICRVLLAGQPTESNRQLPDPKKFISDTIERKESDNDQW